MGINLYNEISPQYDLVKNETLNDFIIQNKFVNDALFELYTHFANEISIFSVVSVENMWWKFWYSLESSQILVFLLKLRIKNDFR